MVKLLRYLKPFVFALVLSAVLLFVQAICDLNLPNYMSQIVNVGIQQNGIEHAAPDAVSEKAMRFEMTFMNDSQKALVSEGYTLVFPGESESLAKKYPLLKTESIYVRKDMEAQQLDQLDVVFGEAAWTFINAMKALPGGPGGAEMPDASEGGEPDMSKLDWNKIYDMQPLFEGLPASAMEAAREQARQNDSSLLKQTGAAMAGSFYEELGISLSSLQTGYILRIGLIMLGITLLGGVATVLVGLMASRIAAGFARDIRRDVFNKVEDFSHTEFDKFSTSSLITRTTNDITQVQMLVMMGIRMICYAPIMGIGGITMAVRKSTSMSWIIAVAVIVLIGLILIIFSIVMPKFKIVQKLIDRLNLVARENLNGLMVIRAFGTQEHEVNRFDKANTDLTRTNLFVNRVTTFMMPAMNLVMNGITLLIVWVGAQQIAQSAMQVGDMMAFMQYAMQIIMSFLVISMMFIMFPRAAVSGNRIQEVLSTEPVIKDPEQPEAFDAAKKGVVEFRNVSFRFDGADEDTLQNISFTAQPGQTTAIIGSTGSGKSTLVNLIPRFYDVTEGEVLVNGVDVRKVPQHQLRDQIGYVPQKGVLLSGTIASNLRYGDDNASDEEIRTAANVAQAEDFIDEKEEGYESPISQGGSNVSGGQKQRLSIARALVKKPPIFIFDDSFSALDFKTDAALRQALSRHTGDSTILLVAQRVSSIMHAEQILVLDEGRLVGRGTHAELMKNCKEYYEIASSQLSKEELE